MTTRMEAVSVASGKKAPPPTAPKRGGRPGYEDDLPPPPPEMMDQRYAQQQQRAPGMCVCDVVRDTLEWVPRLRSFEVLLNRSNG